MSHRNYASSLSLDFNFLLKILK